MAYCKKDIKILKVKKIPLIRLTQGEESQKKKRVNINDGGTYMISSGEKSLFLKSSIIEIFSTQMPNIIKNK